MNDYRGSDLESHGSGDGVPLHARHKDSEAEFAASAHSQAQPVTRQELGIGLNRY
jgi:hypothetical protein